MKHLEKLINLSITEIKMTTSDFKTAYEAGYDAGLNGPNTENCNFSWFCDRGSTKEWERGKKDGDFEKKRY